MSIEKILASLDKSSDGPIRFAVTDLDGVLRGKYISRQKFKKSLEHPLGFCNVIFGWDINDVPYENTTISGWHTGYPDGMASIDPNTYREIPWNEQIPMVLGDFSRDPNLSSVCPRTLLRQIQAESLQMGFYPKFGVEYEWFNFQETPNSLHKKHFSDPTPFTPGMFGYSILRASQKKDFFNRLFQQLSAFRVPLEGLHTETGDGVYEAAMEASDVLEAGDRAILFKTSVKEIAYQNELMACFMAKWNIKLPGCSGHIHQSLWDSDQKQNLFYDEGITHQMSPLMEHYLAGQLYCLPDILPMYAPTVNSYKRLIEGSWAPTTASWGVENRTTAIRVINHNAHSMRIENRVPGADANPYLALAASLASGLYGIQEKLKLQISPVSGNAYAHVRGVPLPKNLAQAVERMKNAPIARTLFGETFVDHFIKTREWEWEQFGQTVTDWELKRYFEII